MSDPDALVSYAGSWLAIVTIAGILALLLALYAWACSILAKFSESRGGSYWQWLVLSFIFTPLFAPSLYFFVNERRGYFIRIFSSIIKGFGFSLIYTPYTMFSSLISRALKD